MQPLLLRKSSIIYSECVYVALGTQNATHMRYIMLTSVVCLHLPYFSTLSHKRNDFREKKKKFTEHKFRVLISYTNFV